MMTSRGLALIFVAAVGSAVASADDNVAKDLYFQCNVGSFKALGNAGDPALGTLSISFKGTLLISRKTPTSVVTVTGSIRKEKEDVRHGKEVYFGEGSVKIVGGFDAVQFFGQNLTGEFHGKGFFRFYGEFDKDLNTGSYWFTPGGKKTDWGTGGAGVPMPYPMRYQAPQVTIKPKGKG